MKYVTNNNNIIRYVYFLRNFRVSIIILVIKAYLINIRFFRHNCCDPAPTVLSGAGICLIVLGYTMFGAFTFMTLENGGRDGVQQQIRGNGQQQQHQHQHQQPAPQQQQQQQHQYQLGRNDKLRAQTVEKLWKITEDLNILYRDNWTRLAEQEILKFQDSLVRKYGAPNQSDRRHRWNFASSFLYSLTLITTIGKCCGRVVLINYRTWQRRIITNGVFRGWGGRQEESFSPSRTF